MKRIIVVFMSLFCLGSMVADNYDIIITTDRQQIQCLVKEIAYEKVMYSIPDRPNSVIYSIPKDKVVLIRFSDGSVELFQMENQPVKHETDLSPAPKDSIVEALQVSATTTPATPTATPVTNVQTEDTDINPVQERIFRDGREYMYNNTYISAKQVGIILKNRDSDAYVHWKRGDNLAMSGCVIAGIGLGATLGGLCTISSSIGATIGLSVTGLVLSGVGATLALCAPLQYEKAVNIYNQKYDKYTALTFTASPQALSLRICF